MSTHQDDQELFEYVHGCHPDQIAFEARLAADPKLQERLRMVRGQSDLLAEAARGDSPELDLAPPTQTSKRGRKAPRRHIKPRRSPIKVIAGTPARAGLCMLFIFLMVSPWVRYSSSRAHAERVATEEFRIVASAPSGIPAGREGQVKVDAWNVDGVPVPADFEWRIVDEAGVVLVEETAKTDGALAIKVAAELTAARAVEIVARSGDVERTVTVPIRADEMVPLAHLICDKPLYRPGETAWMRAVVLDRLSLAPREGRYWLRVIDTKGAPAQSWALPATHGVVPIVWEVPKDAAGGKYVFELRDSDNEFAAERLEFEVRRFQPPQLIKELVLDRESYVLGTQGSAELDVSFVTGGEAANANVTAQVLMDGIVTSTERLKLDPSGHAVFTFDVGEDAAAGDGRLMCRIEVGGIVEAAVETFIVPMGRVDVSLYPEGGALVAGFKARVYAEVSDPAHRPADAKGRVVDSKGRTVAAFETLHQGRARFELLPEAGQSYSLILDEPSGLDPIPLHALDPKSAGLRTTADSYGPGEPLIVDIHTPHAGPWALAAFCRGVLVDQSTFEGAGLKRATLTLPADIAGVLRVTLFDKELNPVAERLLHRGSGRTIDIEVRTADGASLPGSKQSVEVIARDENGDPVQAILGLSVTDSAVREAAGTDRIGLSQQTWLAADVDTLEDAPEFDLHAENGARNVDLLLGTRGWRRFAWVNPTNLVEEFGDAGKRILVREGVSDRPFIVHHRGEKMRSLRSLRSTARSDWESARGANFLGGSFALLLLLAGVLAVFLRRRFEFVALTLVPFAVMTAIGLVYWLTEFSEFSADAAIELDEAPPMEEGEWADLAVFDARAEGRIPVLNADAEMEYDDEGGVNGGWKLGGKFGQRFALGKEAANAPKAEQDGPVANAAAPAHAADPKLVPVEIRDVFQAEEALGQIGYGNGRQRFGVGGRPDAARTIRIYAHRRTARSDMRVDFTETVYWNPLLITDVTGKARVAFDLSDRATTWNVVVDAHGAGRVGETLASFESVPPISAEAKLPIELTEGDVVKLPVAVSATDSTLTAATVDIELNGPFELTSEPGRDVLLKDGRGRVLLPIRALAAEADGQLRILTRGGNWTDQIRQSLSVVPRGFPVHLAKSGLIENTASTEIALPLDFVDGSMSVDLTIYPSPITDLLQGASGMLQEPHGCFEQASSVNYPNVLALAFLDSAGLSEPAVSAKARGLLESGYAKLTGYASTDGGYEWFGGNPGHEALSAYGLLQFHDMAKVFDVDPKVIDGTRAWLLSRRDGKGGYERNARALDSFGRAPDDITNAYVTYSLAITGTPARDFEGELDRMEARGLESTDPYEVALCAGALHAAERGAAAKAARGRLAEMQEEDGSVMGTTSSITRSGGRDLGVETTALTILAWLDDTEHEARVRKAVEWMLEQRGGGRFGSTQATIQALRALSAYASIARRTASAGELTVYVDDYEVARVPIEAGRNEPVQVDNLVEHLAAGNNRLRFELSGGNEMPFALDVRYFADQPADDAHCPLRIETRLGDGRVREGEAVPVMVKVENLLNEGQPMALAIVGLPAGLECPSKVLDELKDAERIDFWERRGREIVLYWRDMAPQQAIDLTLECVARIPGTTTGPASRVYLYYTPNQVRWAQPLIAEIDE